MNLLRKQYILLAKLIKKAKKLQAVFFFLQLYMQGVGQRRLLLLLGKNDGNAAYKIKNNFTSKQTMNILDAQQMLQAEQLLLQVDLHPPYTFMPPSLSLLPTLINFSPSHLHLPARQLQEQTLKMVSNARHIRSVKNDDPNAVLKAFTYSIFSIIFPGVGEGIVSQKTTTNDSLLETLKCSLYSKDLNFNHISNKNLTVDNLQAKAMMASFFHSVVTRKQYNNPHKIKYIEWSLEKNPLLLELFIVFYRIILTKLEVDAAGDYQRPLDFLEAITNLIEYFDINYRNFGELFLITEENHFLASVNSHFVIGQYLENDGYRGKESTKTSDGKVGLQSGGSAKERIQNGKKNGVFQNDIKLFNFILESGRESHIHNDRDTDMETPHFKDSHEFAFGRKKKDEDQMMRQEELKKEFEKFLMNSSAESVQQIGHPPLQLPLHQQLTVGPITQRNDLQSKRQQTDREPNNGIAVTFLRKSTFNQSLIHELEDQVSDQPKANPQTHHKNIVLVKDKNVQSFSPQITNHIRNQGFSSFMNDAMFLDQQANPDLFKSSSGGNAQNPFLYQNECSCVQHKRNKNKIVSKVIQFKFITSKAPRSPKFLQNLKYSQNMNTNTPIIKATPIQCPNLKPYPSNKQLRKPSFLKFLKKDKQADKYSFSSKSKSKSKHSAKDASRSPVKQKYARFELDKQTVNRINDKCTAYSTILTKNQLECRPKQFYCKSTTNRDQSSLSKKMPIEQPILKNFDSKYLNHRPGLGNNWKLNSNFHNSPNHFERSRLQQPPQIQTSRNEKVRVYAPVQIIAPTLYFNGNTERDNRVTFTVNDMGERDKWHDLKRSQRYMRTQPPCYMQERILGSPHQRYI